VDGAWKNSSTFYALSNICFLPLAAAGSLLDSSFYIPEFTLKGTQPGRALLARNDDNAT
jgi:hypothetical protein